MDTLTKLETATGLPATPEKPDVESPDDSLAAAYTAKIEAAYADELAGNERQVGNIITVGKLLLEAKAKLPRGQWMPFVEGLPFGIRKAERRMLIAGTPELANSSNWTILPAHPSTLVALAELDAGIRARAFAGKLIHPDITRSEIDDIVAALVPISQPSPAEDAVAQSRSQEPPRPAWTDAMAMKRGRLYVDKEREQYGCPPEQLGDLARVLRALAKEQEDLLRQRGQVQQQPLPGPVEAGS